MSPEEAMMQGLAKLFASGKADFGRYPKGDKTMLKIQASVYLEDLKAAADRCTRELAGMWGSPINATATMIEETATSFRQEVGGSFPDSADFAERAMSLWRSKFDTISVETEREGRPAVALRLVPKNFTTEQKEAAILALRAAYPAPAPSLPRTSALLDDKGQVEKIIEQINDARRMPRCE